RRAQGPHRLCARGAAQLAGLCGVAGRGGIRPAQRGFAPARRLCSVRPTAFQRLAFVLLASLGFAVLAGMFLAGRMVGPIQALRAGAARIGSGDLNQRITIKTGDELEALADQFNDMAGRLQESYSGLEQKVELRTR